MLHLLQPWGAIQLGEEKEMLVLLQTFPVLGVGFTSILIRFNIYHLPLKFDHHFTILKVKLMLQLASKTRAL